MYSWGTWWKIRDLANLPEGTDGLHPGNKYKGSGTVGMAPDWANQSAKKKNKNRAKSKVQKKARKISRRKK